MAGCEIFYDFKKYKIPKAGIFNIHTNEYCSTTGWVQKEELYTIIGETDLLFVYRLQESGQGEWVGDKVIQHKYIIPIGIHKSRLVRWMDYQLTLF